MRRGGEARGMRWMELEEGRRKRRGGGGGEKIKLLRNLAKTREKESSGRGEETEEKEEKGKEKTGSQQHYPPLPIITSLLLERSATRRYSLLSGIIVQGRGGKVNKTGRQGGSRTVYVLRLQRLWRQGLPLHITLQYEIDGAHGGVAWGRLRAESSCFHG